MYVLITRNKNGSYTIAGYLKRTYYGYSLKEAMAKYRQEAKETGWNGRIIFVKEGF